MTLMSDTATSLHFIEPLPGFDNEDYTLSPIDEHGVLYSLRSVDGPAVRFVLAAAAVFFPGYSPALTAALAEPLGSDEVELLLILTIGTGLADATANLRAPVALSRSTNRAVQVILDDEDLSMRAPLLSQ